jgi:hypothetical protein
MDGAISKELVTILDSKIDAMLTRLRYASDPFPVELEERLVGALRLRALIGRNLARRDAQSAA